MKIGVAKEIKPDEWERTLNTNLSGTFYTIKYAVPYLKKAGGGSVLTRTPTRRECRRWA